MHLWDSDLKLWRVTFEIRAGAEAHSFGQGDVFVVAGDQATAVVIARDLAFSGGGFGEILKDGTLALDHLVVGEHDLPLVAATEVCRVDGVVEGIESRFVIDPTKVLPSLR